MPLQPSTHDILTFLGVPAAPPTLALLDALVAAYIRTVPWESAFRIAKRAATATTEACPRWPDEFWRDALERGGGGTCFESNYAFFALLRALGYDGYLTINDMNEQRACHTAIVVRLEGQPWLVDVGLPLHTPLPLGSGVTRREAFYYTYTVEPVVPARYVITRQPHPQAYAFTLINEPVDDTRYRAATTADYGPDGLFLNRVIANKVIGEQLCRFNSDEGPPHLQYFVNGQRRDVPLEGDVAAGVARVFNMDEATVRAALEVVGH